jgi:hypothetical protein
MSKYYPLCPAPSCTQRGDFCRGFCSIHYGRFRRACIENGSWGSAAPLPQPIVIQRWEWMGSEDELAARCEANERLREQREAGLKTGD